MRRRGLVSATPRSSNSPAAWRAARGRPASWSRRRRDGGGSCRSRVQGASISTASNGGASKVERVGDDELGFELQPREIGGEALQPLGGAVDRRDTARRRARAARSCRRARRKDRRPASPGATAEEPRRQRGGGVLHPPFALGVALELGDRRMRVEAHRAGRQHDAAEPLRPAGRDRS